MSFLERAWQKKSTWLYLLWPLSIVYGLLAGIQRWLTKSASPARPPVPLVVIGNLSVGGTGKTPTVMALTERLKAAGQRPGIISRGYGGKSDRYPLTVTADTPVGESGDEASLLASVLQVPVVVDPDRPRALQALLAEHDVNVVISDDGLQHHRLPRSLEWVLVDGERGLGNGLLLPAGPLRESAARLASVDAVLINGGANLVLDVSPTNCYRLRVQPEALVNQRSGERRPFSTDAFAGDTRVHALTGIGNPDRFFALLAPLNWKMETHIFPDHHRFTAADMPRLEQGDQLVMTAKDAVKCTDFASESYWTLQARMELPDELVQSVLGQISNWQAQAS